MDHRLWGFRVQIFEKKRTSKLGTNIDQERFKRILLFLEEYPLTLRERQFVEAVEKCLQKNGKVTDQQESMLEGIYKEKMWISKAFRGDAAFQLTDGGDQRRKRKPSVRDLSQRDTP
jgi:hypothetical protein